MSGRTRQASALRLVGSDQFQDLGLKCILRAVNGSDPVSERLLLEFFLNRQAEFSEFFNISPRMKLQVLKIGKYGERFLQFARIWVAPAFRLPALAQCFARWQPISFPRFALSCLAEAHEWFENALLYAASLG